MFSKHYGSRALQRELYNGTVEVKTPEALVKSDLHRKAMEELLSNSAAGIASSATTKAVTHLFFDANEEAKVAFTDGRVRHINVGHALVQDPDFWVWYLCVEYLNAHEEGHRLFTDFDLMKSVMTSLASGNLYFPEMEGELPLLSKAVKGGASKVILDNLHGIQNSTEDGFVDHSVVTGPAPGYRKPQSLLYGKTKEMEAENRKAALEKNGTLGSAPVVFLNAVLHYSRYRELSADEILYGGKGVEVFNKVAKPLVEDASRNSDPAERMKDAFRLMEVYLELCAEEMEDQQQNQQSGDGQSDQSESGESQNQEGNGEGQNQNQGQQNDQGSGEGKNQQSGDGQDGQSEGEGQGQSRGQQSDQGNGEGQSGQEGQGSEASEAQSKDEGQGASGDGSESEGQSDAGAEGAQTPDVDGKQTGKSGGSEGQPDGKPGMGGSQGQSQGGNSQGGSQESDSQGQSQGGSADSGSAEGSSAEGSYGKNYAGANPYEQGKEAQEKMQKMLEENSQKVSDKVGEMMGEEQSQGGADDRAKAQLDAGRIGKKGPSKQEEAQEAMEKALQTMEENGVTQANASIGRETKGSYYGVDVRKGTYNGSTSELDQIANLAARNARKILEELENGRTETGLWTGKINKKAYSSMEKRYMKKDIQGQKIPEMAFGVLIDRSGSMREGRDAVAAQAAYISYEMTAGLGYPCFVIGFSGGGSSCDIQVFADERVNHDEGRKILNYGGSGGGTPDAAGIRFATTKLSKIPSDKKVLFVISDGCGNGEADVAVKEAKKKGIEVIVFAIDGCYEYILGNYRIDETPKALQPRILDCADLREFPKKFNKVLRQIVVDM